MRHGIAGNFWTDERLNQIGEVLIAQKLKGAALAGFPYVGTAINLVALFCEASQAPLKRLVFVEVDDLALAVQIAGNFIDDDIVILDERREIAVGKPSFDNDVPFFLRKNRAVG